MTMPPSLLNVECPRCGATAGEPCKNYRGKNCAPHRDRIRPRVAIAPAPEDRHKDLEQRDLFDKETPS